MFFFNKKQKANEKAKEAELQSIRTETHEYAHKAAKNTEKLIKLLEQDKLGVTGKIFYATPGGGRERDKKR